MAPVSAVHRWGQLALLIPVNRWSHWTTWFQLGVGNVLYVGVWTTPYSPKISFFFSVIYSSTFLCSFHASIKFFNLRGYGCSTVYVTSASSDLPLAQFSPHCGYHLFHRPLLWRWRQREPHLSRHCPSSLCWMKNFRSLRNFQAGSTDTMYIQRTELLQVRAW